MLAAVVPEAGLGGAAGPGGTWRPRGCWPWRAVPSPTGVRGGGPAELPVPLLLTAAVGGLAGGDELGVRGTRPFISFAGFIIKQRRWGEGSGVSEPGSVSSDLAGATLPFVCHLGQEAAQKGFDRRQKQTIASLQR